MGNKGTKKGGMKGSQKAKTGPIKELDGVHPDGRPLTVSLQVCCHGCHGGIMLWPA